MEKETGDLIGVAGLKVPEEDGKEEQELVKLELFNGRENAGDGEVVLELGYHIFPHTAAGAMDWKAVPGSWNMAAGSWRRTGSWCGSGRKTSPPGPGRKAGLPGKISRWARYKFYMESSCQIRALSGILVIVYKKQKKYKRVMEMLDRLELKAYGRSIWVWMW